MRPTLIFSGIVSVLVLFGLTGCKSEHKVAARELTSVRSWTVRPGMAAQEVRYSGSVEPLAQVTLAFRTAGIVQSVRTVQGINGRPRPLETGDFVAAGTVLATVRSAEYRARTSAAEAQLSDVRSGKDSAAAQVAEAEAAKSQAALDWDRGRKLFQVQAMTQAELDGIKSRLDASSARVEAARAQVSSAEARIDAARASTDESRVALNDTTLVAPFSGYVVSRSVERGAFMDTGTSAISLADLTRVKIVFGVPDTGLAQLRPGAVVHARIDALGVDAIPATVESVSPIADSATRAFRVEAIASNPQRKLSAGMVASVVISTPAVREQLIVPLSALVRGAEEHDFAVLALEGSTVRKRSVRIGVAQGSSVAVLSGLTANERIVQDGVARLKDGEMVQILQ